MPPACQRRKGVQDKNDQSSGNRDRVNGTNRREKAGRGGSGD